MPSPASSRSASPSGLPLNPFVAPLAHHDAQGLPTPALANMTPPMTDPSLMDPTSVSAGDFNKDHVETLHQGPLDSSDHATYQSDPSDPTHPTDPAAQTPAHTAYLNSILASLAHLEVTPNPKVSPTTPQKSKIVRPKPPPSTNLCSLCETIPPGLFLPGQEETHEFTIDTMLDGMEQGCDFCFLIERALRCHIPVLDSYGGRLRLACECTRGNLTTFRLWLAVYKGAYRLCRLNFNPSTTEYQFTNVDEDEYTYDMDEQDDEILLEVDEQGHEIILNAEDAALERELRARMRQQEVDDANLAAEEDDEDEEDDDDDDDDDDEEEEEEDPYRHLHEGGEQTIVVEASTEPLDFDSKQPRTVCPPEDCFEATSGRQSGETSSGQSMRQNPSSTRRTNLIHIPQKAALIGLPKRTTTDNNSEHSIQVDMQKRVEFLNRVLEDDSSDVLSMPDLLSDSERFSVMTSWLQECQQKHPECAVLPYPNQVYSFPRNTYFLDVRSEKPKLVWWNAICEKQVSGTPRASPFFAALSHSANLNLGPHAKLTQANAAEFKTEGVDRLHLPTIYQDAILITSALGIPYLWIDSLCIFQDSVPEQLFHAGNIQMIFSEAFLVIAAATHWPRTSGQTPNSVLTSVLSPHGPGAQRVHFKKEFNNLDLVFEIEPYLNDFFDTISNGSLAESSGCYQERQLARRILHLTQRGLMWECRTAVAVENQPQMNRRRFDDRRVRNHPGPLRIFDCFPRGLDIEHPVRYFTDPLDDVEFLPRHEAAYHYWIRKWCSIIEEFSAHRVVQLADRLAHIAGIASAVADYVYTPERPHRSIYIAGLFWGNIARQLLWFPDVHLRAVPQEGVPWPPPLVHVPLPQRMTKDKSHGAGQRKQCLPSWSWVSLPVGVCYYDMVHFKMRATRGAGGCDIIPQFQDGMVELHEPQWQFGPVLTASLTVQGAVVPIRISEANCEFDIFERPKCYTMFPSSRQFRSEGHHLRAVIVRCKGIVFFDSDPFDLPPVTLYCLRLGQKASFMSPGGWVQTGLVLMPVSQTEAAEAGVPWPPTATSPDPGATMPVDPHASITAPPPPPPVPPPVPPPPPPTSSSSSSASPASSSSHYMPPPPQPAANNPGAAANAHQYHQHNVGGNNTQQRHTHGPTPHPYHVFRRVGLFEIGVRNKKFQQNAKLHTIRLI